MNDTPDFTPSDVGAQPQTVLSGRNPGDVIAANTNILVADFVTRVAGEIIVEVAGVFAAPPATVVAWWNSPVGTDIGVPGEVLAGIGSIVVARWKSLVTPPDRYNFHFNTQVTILHIRLVFVQAVP